MTTAVTTARLLRAYGREHEYLRLLTCAFLEGNELATRFRDTHLRPVSSFFADYVRRRQCDGALAEFDAPCPFGGPAWH